MRKRAKAALPLLFFSLFISRGAFAQEPEAVPVDTTSPRTLNVIAASLPPVLSIGSALYLNYVSFWRTSERGSHFNVVSEYPYALHNDKIGHAFFSATSSDAIRAGYVLAGVDSITAAWLGFGFALASELTVEVGDGFFRGREYYGFSPGDAVADVVGSAWPLLKTYYPSLAPYDFKISMWPSAALKQGAYKFILDDNESQFFWLSIEPGSAFGIPDWPRWLNLAAGYGVENLRAASYLPDRQGKTPGSLVFIGPDINLRGIPLEGWFWDFLTGVNSHIRISFPALMVYPRVKGFLLR